MSVYLREVETTLRSAFPDAARRVSAVRRNDDDAVLKSVKDIIGEIKIIAEVDRHQVITGISTLQKMGHAIDARIRDVENTVLQPSKKRKTTTTNSPETERRQKLSVVNSDAGLTDFIQAFEKKMQTYVSTEKAVSEKLIKESQTQKVVQSFMDMETKEWKRYESEMANQKSNSTHVAKAVFANVQKERRELSEVLGEMRKIIDNRLAVTEQRSQNGPQQEEKQDKKSEKQSKHESYLIQNCKEMKVMLEKYVKNEMNSSQHFHAESARVRKHLNDELRATKYDLETVEKRAARLEAERDKYKRLYDMERIIKFSSDRDSPRYKTAEYDLTHFQNRVAPDAPASEAKPGKKRREKKKPSSGGKSGCAIC